MELDATTRGGPRPTKNKKKGPRNGPTGKKCYACGKIDYFARDCRSSNRVNRENSLTVTEQYQLNATTQIYLTEDIDLRDGPWEEVTNDSDTSAWQGATDESSDEKVDPNDSHNKKTTEIRFFHSLTWVQEVTPDSRPNKKNLGNNPNEASAGEFRIAGKTVSPQEYKYRKTLVSNNYLHEKHAITDECGDQRCTYIRHDGSKHTLRNKLVTVATFERYHAQVSRDTQHQDHPLLRNCENRSCEWHSYYEILEFEGKTISEYDHFQRLETRTYHWVHPEHTQYVTPDRCKNKNYIIPSHHDWKLMASIAWNLKLPKEDPIHPEHAKLATPFYRAVNCRYHSKEMAYPTEEDLAGKAAALHLLWARGRSYVPRRLTQKNDYMSTRR